MRLRLALILGIATAALALLGSVAAVLAFPFGAATACPGCYRLDRFADNAFIERAATPKQREHAAKVLEHARERVAAFYGGLSANPRVLICVSEDCYRRIRGAGSRGNAFLDLALQLSPRSIDTVIATHELSHIELHHRLGRIRYLMGVIPAWFDEGVAVIVSDDRRYLMPTDAPDRCRVRSEEALPTGIFEWRREMGQYDTRQLYAKSACRVADWMAAKGGAAAVTRLVASIANGAPFAGAYGDAQ